MQFFKRKPTLPGFWHAQLARGADKECFLSFVLKRKQLVKLLFVLSFTALERRHPAHSAATLVEPYQYVLVKRVDIFLFTHRNHYYYNSSLQTAPSVTLDCPSRPPCLVAVIRSKKLAFFNAQNDKNL